MGKRLGLGIQGLAAAAAIWAGAAAPLRATSDAIVRGRVTAAADGSGVPGAAVTLASAQEGTPNAHATTDAAGRFSFPVVTPGGYVLTVAADGFTTEARAIHLEPRDLRSIDIALHLRSVEEAVGVEAPLVSLGSTHSPSSTVLGAEHFEALPPTQHQNLTDAIVTAAPGMIRGHDDFVHVRGHEIALNPIINGVSFWENPHALFSPGISPTVIEAVNVMTGGFPAEYGNRFGGVLDVVTKSGLRMRNDGLAAGSLGEAGRRHLVGEFGGHRGQLGYYAFGSLSGSDRFLSPPDPEAIHDSGRTAHAFFQGDANLEEAGSLRFVAMGDAANLEIPKHPRDLDLRPAARADQRARQASAIGSWTRAGASTLASISGYGRWSRTRLSPAAGPLTARASVDRRLLTLGGKADVTRFVGRQAIKAGFEAVRLSPSEELFYDYEGYRALTHLLGWPHIHVAGGPIEFSGSETGGQLSAYIQDVIPVGRRVTVNAGVRVDRYDLAVAGTHASPRLNVAIDVGGRTLVHASYNRFFVPPPIEGVLSNAAGLTSRIREIGVPLPPLSPSVENQVEFGASRPAGPLQLALTGYFRASDNPVHTTVWPDSRVYSYASFDRERAYGLEGRVQASGLARYGVAAYLNYALGRVRFYNPVTGGFVTEAGHLSETSSFLAPMNQTHTMAAGATYRHARTGLWAGTTLEYGSGTPMGHGGGDHAHDHGGGGEDHEHGSGGAEVSHVPDHFTASVSAGLDLLRDGRRRGRMSLQLDVENLGNEIYLIAQEGEFSPAQYSIPRLVSVSLKYRF
jgi:outer membrane receptor for ferrienterochelin and colicins